MGVLHRPLLIVGLVLVSAGCGGSAARPAATAHRGILFTYAAPPKSRCAWVCGDDIYVWTPGAAPERLTNSPLIPKADPQWSPDGRRIAWAMPPPAICKEDAETCGGKFGCVDEIYVADSGGQPVQVSPAYRDSSGNTGCSTAPLSWSPDGKQLLLTQASDTAPRSPAILTLATGAVEPLHLGDVRDAVWGKPGIAFVSADRIHVVAPSPGGPKFVVPAASVSGLVWSSRGELATGQGKRIVIYSSSGRRVADFGAPLGHGAPYPLVWSPDGGRLLVCVAPDRRPNPGVPISYVVDRDGSHWQRVRLPYPQKKETLCSATSWR